MVFSSGSYLAYILLCLAGVSAHCLLPPRCSTCEQVSRGSCRTDWARSNRPMLQLREEDGKERKELISRVSKNNKGKNTKKGL